MWLKKFNLVKETLNQKLDFFKLFFGAWDLQQ